MYKKLVVGIDESYTRTGISIAADSKLLKVSSIAFNGANTPSDKRRELACTLNHILKLNVSKASETLIICERIRAFSINNGKNSFMSINYIKATAALIATIVDTAYGYGVPVYSVDTRSWKAQVVGTTKAKNGNNKLLTIEYITNLGFGSAVQYTNAKGKLLYNDDAADSAGIALYGFIPKNLQKLKLEK
jgi:hypothetical protein